MKCTVALAACNDPVPPYRSGPNMVPTYGWALAIVASVIFGALALAVWQCIRAMQCSAIPRSTSVD